MKSISQLTKTFFEHYYNTYKTYNVYVKGFAFGLSNEITASPGNSDYGINSQGIYIRKGNYPDWALVNSAPYNTSFYVGNFEQIEGTSLNYSDPKDLYNNSYDINDTIDISDRLFSYNNGIFTLTSGTALPTVNTKIYKYILTQAPGSTTQFNAYKITLITTNSIHIDTTFDQFVGELNNNVLNYLAADKAQIQYIFDSIDISAYKFSYSLGTFTVTSGGDLPSIDLAKYKYICRKTDYFPYDYDIYKITSVDSTTIHIDTGFNPFTYGSANQVLNYVGNETDIENNLTVNNGTVQIKNTISNTTSAYHSAENCMSLRLTIPNALPFSFNYDELYVYVALYPKTDTWDSVNKKYPNEIVDFAYYANVTGNSGYLTYNPQALIKFTYDINLRLYYLYQRINLSAERALLMFNAPEPNDMHVFIKFLTATAYARGDYTLNSGTHAITLRLVDPVHTYYNSTNVLEGYIFQGAPADIAMVNTTFSLGSNLISAVQHNIIYLPSENQENNNDIERDNIYYDQVLSDAQKLYYSTYKFQVYADINKLYLTKLIYDNLYFDVEYYNLRDREVQANIDSLTFKKQVDSNTQELSTIYGLAAIIDPTIAKRSVIQSQSYQIFTGGAYVNSITIAPGVVRNIYCWNLSLYENSVLDLVSLGLSDKKVNVLNYDLQFDFSGYLSDFHSFYFIVLNASNAIITKYYISAPTQQINIIYNSNYKYGIAVADSSSSFSFQTITISKVLKYNDIEALI